MPAKITSATRPWDCKNFYQCTGHDRVFLFSVDGYNLGLVAPINPQDIRTSEVPCASSDWPILENRKTLPGTTDGLINSIVNDTIVEPKPDVKN